MRTVRQSGVAGVFALLCALHATGQDSPAPSPTEPPAPPQAPVRRYALVIGNDEGGDGTRELLFARDDAKKIHDILLRVGGVQPDDASLLLDESADDVLTALGELERKARDARLRGERTALFFYYSGHAKDGSLRLGGSRLPMESLKQRLTTAQVDVRVAVFDACRSGAMTRAKGVRKAPAFEVESDLNRQTKGLVILTSSSANEDSQESDLLGGSYFSHHLASGLLGDADKSGDGRVTLSEAYAYAYERTVADTAESTAGAQHPTFSFDLAGNGDLVLTDFAQRKEGLRLPATSPAGTYFVVGPGRAVVAEIYKPSNTERLVALPPGKYVIKRREADHLVLGNVSVAAGAITTVDESLLKKAKFSDDPVKGVERVTLAKRHWSAGLTGSYQAIFDAPTSRGGYFPSAPVLGVDVTWHNAFGRGFSVSFDGLYGWASGNVVSGVVNANYRYSLVSVGSTGLWEMMNEQFIPFVGVRLGLNIMSREFPESGLPAQSYQTFTPGLVLGLRIRLTRSFNVTVRGRLHYLLYNVDETRNFGYGEVAGVLTYEWRD